MDEHPTSFIALLLKSFWRGNEYTWPGPVPDVIDPDYLAQLSAGVIREAAKLGHCVIVGRGAQCVLQDREDILHVFVYGSHQRKLERAQERHSTRTECEGFLAEVDATRAAFIHQHYRCDWTNRHLYDLMISSDMGVERTAMTILSAAGLLDPKQILKPELTAASAP